MTAVPLCDGHDSAISTINVELVRRGFEVVYTGYHQAASSIARAAVQEDARAIGLSSYNGGHVVFFREVLAQLRARGGGDVLLFGGGGGTITPADERLMKRAGVTRLFFAGTPLAALLDAIERDCERPARRAGTPRGDRALARAITALESTTKRAATPKTAARRALSVGVAGPGGAGKSTLIDELVSRFLGTGLSGRIAVLANDPSHPGAGGALLGDRVSAIYAQDDRVFFRSLATRGSASGVSDAAPGALELLQASGEFELVFVESVGIGQESDPFGVLSGRGAWVDAVLFVLPPHYGGRLQLQKIPLLDGADWVALNKCDDPRAGTARRELAARLEVGSEAPELFTTVAGRHADRGVDALYQAIRARISGRRAAS